jgi:hypothetical protein
MEYRFEAELWVHTGEAAWHFVTLPVGIADEIDELTTDTRRGFGSVRVIVTVGSTRWSTSIFPDTSTESFVLPVKKPVRTSEGLHEGDLIEVTLQLADPGVVAT